MEEESSDNVNTTQQTRPLKSSARRVRFYGKAFDSWAEKFVSDHGRSKPIVNAAPVKVNYPVSVNYLEPLITRGVSAINYFAYPKGLGKMFTAGSIGFHAWTGSDETQSLLNVSLISSVINRSHVVELGDFAVKAGYHSNSSGDVRLSIDHALDPNEFLELLAKEYVTAKWERDNLAFKHLGFESIVSDKRSTAVQLLMANLFSRTTLKGAYSILQKATTRLVDGVFRQWGVDILRSFKNLMSLGAQPLRRFNLCEVDILRKSLVKRLFYIYPSEEDERGQFAVWPLVQPPLVLGTNGESRGKSVTIFVSKFTQYVK